MIRFRAHACGFLVLTIVTLPAQAGDKKGELPVVPVSKPVERMVVDSADYTGRTSAKDHVTIQPRVTGHITKIPFEEGAEVKAGDVLFEIDPRPYQAQLAAAKAKVAQSEAGLKYAKAVNAQFKDIAKKQPDAVAKKELAQYQAQEEQAAASLELDKANLQTAMLNLDWTVVRAPIAGRAGRANLTVGNLVKQDETQLTNLVSTDPIHVTFDMDEATLLRIRRAAKEAKHPAKVGAELVIQMQLADEESFPHRGTVSFVDSQVNPNTGTVQARAVFANPKSKDGVPLVAPGMFARLRLPLGKPQAALLVIDRAVMSDQRVKFVYVVDAENKVEARRIKLGPLQADGLRVVEEGLKKGDTVIVGSLQRIRPGLRIQPELVAMPTIK